MMYETIVSSPAFAFLFGTVFGVVATLCLGIKVTVIKHEAKNHD